MGRFNFPIKECPYCGGSAIEIKQKIRGYGTYKVYLDNGEKESTSLHDYVSYKNTGKYAICAECRRRLFKVDNDLNVINMSKTLKMLASISDQGLTGIKYKEIKFPVRGEPHYVYITIPILEKPYFEVKFDVSIKETIKCSKNYKWILIHQETEKVLVVDTETVFNNIALFYEYTVAVPYGPKIYAVTKLH